ncbi:MAG: hypothetical protein QNK05_02230 [Myxococcota bacterium]|nr:hypothetical protein [Myxococcota bacterium]
MNGTRRRVRARLAGLALLALTLAANPASPPAAAQGFHGGGPTPRPLHVRMAEAQVAAVVDIAWVEEGRIGVELRQALLGSPPESFEIKRAPSNPPPLASGERAVVILRGARPPYVLVDEAHETIRISDDEMGERWSRAARDVAERLESPAELALLYARWLDQGPATLRELGARGLGDEGLDVPEAHERLGADRARAAFDPTLPPDVRQLSAVLAGRSSAGAAALIERIRVEQPSGILGVALRAGAAHEVAGTEALFLELLAHPEVRIRAETLRAAGPMQKLIGEERTLTLVARIGEDDQDEGMRRMARRVHGQLVRNDPHIFN